MTILKVFISQPLKTSPRHQSNLESHLKPLIDTYLNNQPYTLIQPEPTDTIYKLPIDTLADYIYYISQANLVIFPKNWQEHKDCLVQNIICNLYDVPNITEQSLTISEFISKNNIDLSKYKN